MIVVRELMDAAQPADAVCVIYEEGIMHLIRITGCALAVGALLVACAEQTPVDPAETATVAGPAFNFANGPENPGTSPVYRYKDTGFLSVFDFDQGLRIRLYDTFNTFRCPGGTAPDPVWDYQDVEDPRVKSVGQVQDVPIVVYPFPNTPGKPFCQFLAEDWLYRGMGQARVNDNNVFWFTGTGGNNAYGIRVQGTVEDPAGVEYQITGKNHYTIRGLCCFFFYDNGTPVYVDPADEWVEEMSIIETIKIHP